MAKKAKQVVAEDIPCHVMNFCTDYHYSDEWGNKLLEIWIATKRAFLEEGFSVEVFRNALKSSILEAIEVEDAFVDGCHEVGVNPDFGSKLYESFYQLQMDQALSLIPSNLHAELCWTPEWDGKSLDDLLDIFGMTSDHYRSSAIEDVRPGKWLEVFLKMVNCSSVDLIGTAIQERGNEGKNFAEKCAKANFKVEKDQNRLQLLTATQVITAIENGYFNAVPMAHWEVNLKALFEADPSKAMRMESDKGRIHVGFHEFWNGAGYMDTYKGELVVPADAIGFAGANRWAYGIDKVYCLVRSAFRATPVSIDQN